MKKRLIGLLVTILAVFMLANPALASIDIQAIYYDFNAAENESVLTVMWTGRPASTPRRGYTCGRSGVI